MREGRKDMEKEAFKWGMEIPLRGLCLKYSLSVPLYRKCTPPTLINLSHSPLASLPPFLIFRWDRVAEVVPDKSKAQCFKRFKELRDLHRSKKVEGGAPGGGGGAEE